MSHLSDLLDRLDTDQRDQNSGPARSLVPSSATALAPFSQNSKAVRWSSGSGHAHRAQCSKPTSSPRSRRSDSPWTGCRPTSARPFYSDHATWWKLLRECQQPRAWEGRPLVSQTSPGCWPRLPCSRTADVGRLHQGHARVNLRMRDYSATTTEHGHPTLGREAD